MGQRDGDKLCNVADLWSRQFRRGLHNAAAIAIFGAAAKKFDRYSLGWFAPIGLMDGCLNVGVGYFGVFNNKNGKYRT
ncbi:hypothetical protein [Nisaea sediminum]|uniref:hypothetical protein n=1 Tax=Nisaea sediminum TaxID=2775867 RepID=UPI001865AAA1|nr:hypothetical protein [Nisaea sediminum]